MMALKRKKQEEFVKLSSNTGSIVNVLARPRAWSIWLGIVFTPCVPCPDLSAASAAALFTISPSQTKFLRQTLIRCLIRCEMCRVSFATSGTFA